MDAGSRHGSRGNSGSAGSSSGRARAARPARPAAPLPDADRLTRLLDPVVHALGMDLENVRVTAAGRRRLLRVIVDADGGVSLDTIALASRELSARLDGASEMGELPYTLEVSSPGVDRPLTEPRHWRRATGRLVVAPLTAANGDHGGNGRSPVEGRIAGTSDRGVTLDCDGVLREFGYAELGPGRVQIEFGRLEPGDDDFDDDASADDNGADDDRAEED